MQPGVVPQGLLSPTRFGTSSWAVLAQPDHSVPQSSMGKYIRLYNTSAAALSVLISSVDLDIEGGSNSYVEFVNQLRT